VHLVGFIIRIYHDAWSSECHILIMELHDRDTSRTRLFRNVEA